MICGNKKSTVYAALAAGWTLWRPIKRKVIYILDANKMMVCMMSVYKASDNKFDSEIWHH